MSEKRVVVTGLGVVTPVGETVEDFWNSLIEGRSSVKRIQSFDPSNFSSQIASEATNFDPSKFLNSKEI